MYVGVYATLLASTLYTLNLVVLVVSVFVIAVHHKIVLTEEEHMKKVLVISTRIIAVMSNGIYRIQRARNERNERY